MLPQSQLSPQIQPTSQRTGGQPQTFFGCQKWETLWSDLSQEKKKKESRSMDPNSARQQEVKETVMFLWDQLNRQHDEVGESIPGF